MNISLNDVVTDNAVWSQRYDGTLEDVFEFQENVARNVVASLELELTDDKQDAPLIDAGTRNAQAYNSFLLGTHSFVTLTARGFTIALDHLNHAVSLDPSFGRAHYYIYLCNYLTTEVFGAPRELLIPKAQQSITPMQNVFARS